MSPRPCRRFFRITSCVAGPRDAMPALLTVGFPNGRRLGDEVVDIELPQANVVVSSEKHAFKLETVVEGVTGHFYDRDAEAAAHPQAARAFRS